MTRPAIEMLLSRSPKKLWCEQTAFMSLTHAVVNLLKLCLAALNIMENSVPAKIKG